MTPDPAPAPVVLLTLVGANTDLGVENNKRGCGVFVNEYPLSRANYGRHVKNCGEREEIVNVNGVYMS